MTHTVQQGENLYRIGLKYKVAVDDLKLWNGLTDVAIIRAGQILRVSGEAQPVKNESLIVVQKRFVRHKGHFINYAYANDYELTDGEAWRTEYQQAEYVRTGLSKTMDSRHLKRCAQDYIIWYKGRQLFTNGQTEEQRRKDLEDCRPLGEYWMSLHSNNVWGADFNRNYDLLDDNFSDPYHIETK